MMTMSPECIECKTHLPKSMQSRAARFINGLCISCFVKKLRDIVNPIFKRLDAILIKDEEDIDNGFAWEIRHALFDAKKLLRGR
jgi:hypothetical protein